MKRFKSHVPILAKLALVFSIAGSTFASELSRKTETKVFIGTINQVKDRQLTLLVGGTPKEFTIAADALILVNGKRAPLKELVPGTLAKVKCKVSSTKIATVIDATRKY